MGITFIIATYNAEDSLAITLDSLVNQTDCDFEVFISDGASTDNTVNIIESFKSQLQMKYISQKDNGIYHALNNGISNSSSDYINIIMAGDFHEPDFVAQVKNKLHHFDFIYGSSVCHTSNGEQRKYDPPKRLDISRITGMPFAHPSLVYRRLLHEDIGFYDESYKFASDLDFVMKLIKGGYTYSYSAHVTNYVTGGVGNSLTSLVETYKILSRYDAPKFLVLYTLLKQFVFSFLYA